MPSKWRGRREEHAMYQLQKKALHLNMVVNDLSPLLLVILIFHHILYLGGILTGLCVTLGYPVKWKACN